MKYYTKHFHNTDEAVEWLNSLRDAPTEDFVYSVISILNIPKEGICVVLYSDPEIESLL